MDKDHLPHPDTQRGIEYSMLIEGFLRQFWAFSEFLNDSEGKVPTEKYADFLVFCLDKEVKKRLNFLDKDVKKD